MAFTDKQAAFIEFKVAGATHEEAAASAGYARSSASVTASKLMKRADIKAAVAKGKRELGGSEPESNVSTLEPWKLKDRYDSPLDLLRDVMNNPKAPGGLRIQCAKDAMPYCHARKETSKKDDAKDNAKKTGATSKFGTMPTPLRRAA